MSIASLIHPATGFRSMILSLVSLGLVLLLAANSGAQTIPVLRIPKLAQPPAIDGTLNPREWEHAARITGFQDFRSRTLTAPDLQPTWYLGYDEHNLYLAQNFPVYPKGTIKAAVKEGDNGGQNPNSDDILSDDHIEIQICDLPAREQAIKQYFYKIMTNPYGAVVDQRTEWSVGWMGFEWESKALVRVQTNDDGWTMEMAIPWKNLGHAAPPVDNTSWFMQLVSAGGADTFYNAWQPVLWTAWDLMPEVIFDAQAPVFQLLSLDDVGHGKLDVKSRIEVPKGQTPVEMTVRVVDANGKELFAQTQSAAGEGRAAELNFTGANLPLSAKGNTLHLLTKQGESIVYRAAMPFDQASEAALKHSYELLATNRAGAGQPRLASCYYHSYRKLTASCDVDILKIDPKFRAAKLFRTRIEHEGKAVLSVNGAINSAGQGRIEAATPNLAAGDYQAVTEIISANGAVLASRRDAFSVRSFPWQRNKLGTQKIVVAPFTSVEVQDLTLKVWNRALRFDATGLPASIVSKGQELLAAPIRLEGKITGKAVELQSAGAPRWVHKSGTNSTLEAHNRLAHHVDVTVQADTEYDGTTNYTLTLKPLDTSKIERLDLVIPLRKLTDWEAIRSSGRDIPYGTVPATDGVFWDSSRLSAAPFIHGTFLPYCVLSDGERGLSWAADSDQGWLLDDAKPSFFLEKRGDQVMMRARLINTPSALKQTRTIRFMLTAMPTKPLPEDHRYRTWGIANAPFGWMNGFQGSGMWAYGAGPTVSFTNQQQYDVLRERLEADRRRVRLGAEAVPGPKYLPMSAWYVATNTMGYAMPEYDTYCGEWAGVTSPQPSPQGDYVNFKNEWGTWNTPRQQSRAYADLVPSTVDCRVYSFDQQQKQAGMNGYWWDHNRFWTSGDLIKGGAYIRDDGKVQGIYNISLMRSMMKRMAVCSQLNGLRPFHGYYSHGEIGPTGSFMQWLWAIEGPWYVNSSKVSLLDNMRGGLDGIRVLLQTYQGLPVTMRNETMDRDSDNPWQTRSCLGVALLFDVGLGFEGGSVNEKARTKLVSNLIKFDYFNPAVTWIPYWRTQSLVQVEGGDVVTTLYTRRLPGQTPGVMLVLFNKGEHEATVSLRADAKELLSTTDVSLHDLENLTADALISRNNRWPGLTIPRHGFRLLLLSPNASGG